MIFSWGGNEGRISGDDRGTGGGGSGDIDEENIC